MNAQNISEILDALAARFGTTGVHLWEVLVRQQYVEAIWGLGFIAMTIVLIWLWVHWIRKCMKDKEYYMEEEEVFLYSVLGVVLFILAIVSIVELFTTTPGFFNPEFYALQELLP